MRWREKIFGMKICENELCGQLTFTLCIPQPQPFYNFSLHAHPLTSSVPTSSPPSLRPFSGEELRPLPQHVWQYSHPDQVDLAHMVGGTSGESECGVVMEGVSGTILTCASESIAWIPVQAIAESGWALGKWRSKVHHGTAGLASLSSEVWIGDGWLACSVLLLV